MLKKLATLSIIVMLFSLSGCGNPELGTFTPATPSNVTALKVDGASGAPAVVISWSASKGTTPSQGATFTVYRGQTATGTLDGKTKVAEGLTATSYIDTSAGAVNSFYLVTATIYGLESAPSREVAVINQGTTAAAVTLSGTTGSAANTLSWSTVPGATGYQIYRGVTPTGSLQGKMPWHNSGSDSTSFTDSTVSVGLTYYYQVVSLSLNGQSLPSNEVAITTR